MYITCDSPVQTWESHDQHVGFECLINRQNHLSVAEDHVQYQE